MHRKWYRLDTAALIFPAIARRDWCNAFRVSATLTEAVDPEILQQAVSDLRRHFPNFFVTLRKGFFWYYLEESPEPVSVRGDYAYPLTFMGSRELKRNCLRVLYYKNRIACEFFHSLTDGHGGSIFLAGLTLIACHCLVKLSQELFLLIGQFLYLAYKLLCFFGSDKFRRLDGVNQEFELRKLKLPAADIISAGTALVFQDVQSEIL